VPQLLNHHFFERAIVSTETDIQGNCPHCGARSGGAHFCPECRRIQALAPGTDYFTFFGLPKRLRIDEAELEKSFYSLSRQFHPDYFMAASSRERQASVERSSMLNDAYRTLRDRVRRAGYLLQLEGYKEAEKKAPPDLLEEVFELNMQVEQLKAAKKMGDEDEIAEARSELEEALGGLESRMSRIGAQLYELFAVWDDALDGSTEGQRAALDRISELLSQRSYVSNLVRDIKEEI
jgi:molecular chaperone HscB